jgi:uncharacterized membrane protein YkgB
MTVIAIEHRSPQGRSIEERIGTWLTAHSGSVMRWSLGMIFLWFGLMKLCPGLCDVEVLAQKTISVLTFGRLSAAAGIRCLAVWEAAMGLTLLFARPHTRWGKMALRVCAALLLVHLAGTFLPLALFPGEVWKHAPYAPTLVGQYILKNLVLMAAALSIGAGTFATAERFELVPAQLSQPITIRRSA